MNTRTRLTALTFFSSLLALGGCTVHADSTKPAPSNAGTSGDPSTPADTTTQDQPDSSLGTELFAVQGKATPGSIFGTWGGSQTDLDVSFDTRTRFAASSMSVAIRCTGPGGEVGKIAGLQGSARISDEKIEILESKSDKRVSNGVTCTASITPSQIPACDPATSEIERSHCFVIEGTKMTIYGDSSLQSSVLTKISD